MAGRPAFPSSSDDVWVDTELPHYTSDLALPKIGDRLLSTGKIILCASTPVLVENILYSPLKLFSKSKSTCKIRYTSGEVSTSTSRRRMNGVLRHACLT